MSYRRVRLAMLLISALVLLVGPTPGAGAIKQARSSAARPVPPATATAAPLSPQASAPAAVASPAGSPAATTPTATTQGAATPSKTAGGSGAPGSPAPGNAIRTTGSPAVALTFDDGPDPVNTPLILDLLKQQEVKATFCLVGFRARDNPDLVRRIAAEGHALCNHSWQHLFDLGRKPADFIRQDLEATNQIIRAAVPGAVIRYFRAPGGNFTTPLVNEATALGMASIYWQVDPRDWEHGAATPEAHTARVIRAVQQAVKPGSIVLSHDNKQPTTIEAYRILLPWLKTRYALIALP